MTVPTQAESSWRWRWLIVEVLIFAAFWIFAVSQLWLNLGVMRFLTAFFYGAMVFVIPFHLWHDVPKVVEGWKERS